MPTAIHPHSKREILESTVEIEYVANMQHVFDTCQNLLQIQSNLALSKQISRLVFLVLTAKIRQANSLTDLEWLPWLSTPALNTCSYRHYWPISAWKKRTCVWTSIHHCPIAKEHFSKLRGIRPSLRQQMFDLSSANSTTSWHLSDLQSTSDPDHYSGIRFNCPEPFTCLNWLHNAVV